MVSKNSFYYYLLRIWTTFADFRGFFIKNEREKGVGNATSDFFCEKIKLIECGMIVMEKSVFLPPF